MEMLIVLGIMGAIGGVMALTTATIVRITPQSNDQMIALRQVQNAGYWISRDVQMAQTIDSAPATGEFLKLTLKVVGDADITVIYKLAGMSSLKQLMRTSEREGVIISTMLVAEDIYYDPDGDPGNSTKIINEDLQTPPLSIRITAKSGDAMVIKKYEATQRVPQ